MQDDDFERRAGKSPEDAHPQTEPRTVDRSDYSDPRVAQPGEDPPDETALRPVRDGGG